MRLAHSLATVADITPDQVEDLRRDPDELVPLLADEGDVDCTAEQVVELVDDKRGFRTPLSKGNPERDSRAGRAPTWAHAIYALHAP